MMETGLIKHRKIEFGGKTYYLGKFPEGDWHIHVVEPYSQDGYAGGTINFPMEDGTMESRVGPFCCDGSFNCGLREKLAVELDDETLLREATRLTVGRELSSWKVVNPADIVYEEEAKSIKPWRDRIKKEWDGLDVLIEGRGYIAKKIIEWSKIEQRY